MNYKQLLEKFNKKAMKLSAISVLIILMSASIACIAANVNPYAMLVDGEEICYVRGELGAKNVIKEMAEMYLPEGTEMKIFSTGGRVSYKRANSKTMQAEKFMSVEDAASYIIETYQKKGEPINVKIASTKKEIQKFTPKPKYIKNKEMLAGASKLKKKGRKGKREIIITYTSVNGEIKTQSPSGAKVIDKGKKAIVYKGILGLPKGKNWKTYKGLPVFRNGRQLVITSKNYIGAPYKYGGTSLKYGIDCVQFVRQMYAKYGIDLPNNHGGIQHYGKGISYKKIKKGDIICYGDHIGIYVGKGRMINAVKKGVKISKVKKKRIKTIRRVVK